MKIFTNKSLFKKLIIVIIAIMIFSAIIPPKVSFAEEEEDRLTGVAGALAKPVVSLLIGLGDILMDVIHKMMFDQSTSFIEATPEGTNVWKVIGIIILVIVVIIAVAFVIYKTGGLGVKVLQKVGVLAAGGAVKLMGKLFTTAVSIGAKAGIVVGAIALLKWHADKMILPMYQISPEEIFRGEIALLDANFFKNIKGLTKEEMDAEGIASEQVETVFDSVTQNLKTISKEVNDYPEITPVAKNVIEDMLNGALSFFGANQTITCTNVLKELGLNKAGDEKPIYLNWNYDGNDYSAKFVTRLSTYTNTDDGKNPYAVRDFTLLYLLWVYDSEGNPLINGEITGYYYERAAKEGTLWSVTTSDYKLIAKATLKKKITSYAINEALKNAGCPHEIDVTSEDFWGGTLEVNKSKTLEWDGEDDVKYKAVIAINEDYGNSESATELTYVIGMTIYRTTWVASKTIGSELKPAIAKWYYAVRNIVLVVMMIILLYTGIRIIISSVSSEKAKYKNMLLDWLVAICLVFVMHYIMILATYMTDGIIDIFKNLAGGTNEYISFYEVEGGWFKAIDEALDEARDQGMDIDYTAYDLRAKDEDDRVTTLPESDGGNDIIMWDSKNIVGLVRMQCSLTETGTILWVGYGIMFLVLVFYTIFFIFTYMKRVLYLAFFTIIAPLVAMTYPIDKMHDGKAQAFNMWLKEYIFNLILPLVHLLLYTILIYSAFELASTNILYTLVAIGFMMPAEKFLRKMFGFDKAQTPGFLSGAAGAGLMMGLAGKLFHKRPSKGSNNENVINQTEKEDKINMKDDSMVDPSLLAGEETDKHNSNTSLKDDKVRLASERNVLDEFKAEGASSKEWKPEDYKALLELEREQAEKEAKLKQKKLQQEQQKGTTPQQSNTRGQQVVKKNTKGNGKRSIGRGIKAASKAYAKRKLTRAGNYLASGQPFRSLAKFGGGLFLGATGAALGATLGIASGEIGNVGKYGATLGAGGYALGARDIKSSPDVERAYQEYERAQYDSEAEYRKHLLEERRKAVATDDRKLEELRTYLQLQDQQEAREYMEKYGKCIDAGLDMEDMAAVIKAVEEQGWNTAKGITAAKQLKKAGGKPKNMGKEDRENIEYQYRNIFKAKGITDEKELDENVRVALKSLDTFGKIKDDLTQV